MVFLLQICVCRWSFTLWVQRVEDLSKGFLTSYKINISLPLTIISTSFFLSVWFMGVRRWPYSCEWHSLIWIVIIECTLLQALVRCLFLLPQFSILDQTDVYKSTLLCILCSRSVNMKPSPLSLDTYPYTVMHTAFYYIRKVELLTAVCSFLDRRWNH